MWITYRNFTRGLVVMALATVVAACPGDQERTANGVDTASAAGAEIDRPEPDAATQVNVTLDEWSVSHSADSLARGQATFAVVNNGTMPHSLEIQGPGGTWTSPPIPPAGESVLMSLLIEPGEYELSCPDDTGEHKKRGMASKVVVY